MSGQPQPVREHLSTLAFSENDPIRAEAEAEADKEGSEGNAEHGYGQYNPEAEGQIAQDGGVTRIEALYLIFGKGWGIYAFWASIDAQFATSAFGQHTIIGTIGVINAIVAGVAPPFIAKLADIWSRPHTLTLCVVLYAVGYAMCAGAKNIQTVVAGQWRAFVDGAVNLPYVVNAFVAGYIVEDINAYSQNGWRWGYGMFCILLPVAMSPALAVLLIGDYRAKKLGVSLAKKTEIRTQTLTDSASLVEKTTWQKIRFYWTRLNAFGLLLMGFGFACLLTPMTLNTSAKGGYTNPSLIAMLVIGGILFIGWLVWDCFYAEYPFMPRRVLNRTFLACVGVDFFYFFSSYLVNAYFTSWVYVVVDWSDRNYTFFNNTVTVAMCGFAVFFGLLMRYTHRYKYLQLIGLSIRIIGMGLTYHATKSPTDAVLVMSQVCIGFGGAISVIASYIGAQGSVPHQDMAIATAVLNLWSSIGSSISIAISSSIWNKEVPAHLATYLGDTYNSTELAGIFGSIYVARATEPRALVKQAYMESVNKLFLAALIVSFGSILCGIFASNFYLDQKHNAIEQHKIIKFRNKKEIEEELKEKERE
ncbi:hypothetical protein IAU59_003660 [Kwoniella sp. CBS 9459]